MITSTLEWKPELASPLGYAEEDDWFLNEAEGKHNDVEDDNFSSLTRKEIAEQLLHNIDSFVKQENQDTFSLWFEDKIDLPIFDEIEPVLPTEGARPVAEELKDLEGGLDAANLTPPLSPDNTETAKYITLDYVGESMTQYGNDSDESRADQPAEYSSDQVFTEKDTPSDAETATCIIFDYVGERGTQYGNDSNENRVNLPTGYSLGPVFTEEDTPDYLTAPPTPVPDLEREMAVVDEVVRSTAQTLGWESDSRSESFGSPGSVGLEEESDDPEWVPTLKKAIVKGGRAGRRSKPYGRECSQEDRWLRKKEQNKNAATRYRQKKKAELSEIIEEEKKLEEQKVKLKERFADIQMEIKYIKGLMRDLFKAKGLLIN